MTGVRSRRRKREDAKGFGHESLLLALSSEKCGGAFGSWSEERATTRPLAGLTDASYMLSGGSCSLYGQTHIASTAEA